MADVNRGELSERERKKDNERGRGRSWGVGFSGSFHNLSRLFSYKFNHFKHPTLKGIKNKSINFNFNY